MIDESQMLSILKDFPTVNSCFSEYIKWLFHNDCVSFEKNDLIWAITTDTSRLESLEALLNSSMNILGLDIKDFCHVFGFKKDLHTSDHEKVHDILAEPSLAVNLHEHGFTNIKKLPKSIKADNKRLPIADFRANYGAKVYAVEVKTIRMEDEKKAPRDKPLGPALIPAWWRTMLKNNILTKIQNKNHKLIKQLQNTCKHYNCGFSMLAIYTRRLGPSTLTNTEGYREELRIIANKYPNIDLFLLKDYFGEIVFYPPLAKR